MWRHGFPSLTALRAFDAVGSTLSFTRAASLLGVTQAAVSRQIKRLETDLGVQLVIRGATANTLTPAGQQLYAAVRAGFDEIEAALDTLPRRRGRDTVTVSVAPYFSARWLTPRITAFLDAHPGIDVRLHHSYQPPEYRRDDIDMGINWCREFEAGLSVSRVLDGALTPVASRAYVAQHGPFDRPADLANQHLFYEFEISDWTAWFASAGAAPPISGQSTRLDDSSALRRAALEGLGVALFFRSLILEDCNNGQLVQLFPDAVDTGYHYFLNFPEGRTLTASARKFRRWILDEAKASPRT